MLTFRPIVYADADLRAFKYTGSATKEGQFVKLDTTNTALNVVAVTAFTGTVNVLATLPITVTGATINLYDTKAYFPVYRENPDIESVSATISQNDFVVGFAMKTGNEFEIHKSVTETGFATTWTSIGQKACLGSTGKLTPAGGSNTTGLVIGYCLGTFGSKYIRVRAI